MIERDDYWLITKVCEMHFLRRESVENIYLKSREKWRINFLPSKLKILMYDIRVYFFFERIEE